MPNAGLLELVAHGVQDAYLIGNPQISFFRKVHKRHTNFVMQSISGTFEGQQNFGQRLVCKVPRNGDLLQGVVLEIDLPELTSNAPSADTTHQPKYVDNLGEAIIDYVELRIGGQRIDRQYGEWMHIWNELTLTSGRKTGYDRMVRATGVNGPLTVYIPLQFWFCRNIASALPLVALQYHEVELAIQLNSLAKLYKFGETHYYDLKEGSDQPSEGAVGNDTKRFIINNKKGKEFGDNDAFVNGGVPKKVYQSLNGSGIEIDGKGSSDGTGSPYISTAQDLTISTTRVYIKPNYTLTATPKISSMRIFYDFIFLDTYERKWFAQNEHKYIIDELQFQDSTGINKLDTSKKIELNFNLPVKELYWVMQSEENVTHNNVIDFKSTPDANYEAATELINNFTIHYNGIERFEARGGEYFRLVLPYQKHTNVPFAKYIYCYPFSHNPEIYQPMGASNFSKIDTVDMIFNFNQSTMALNTGNYKIRVYGLSYNVLVITKGMGGKRFAN
tara:strand:+ start:8195 stop:9700 length:1506 start_codon:yes stop_codon:yes gene_type:complete